jgi:hypothetical protein
VGDNALNRHTRRESPFNLKNSVTVCHFYVPPFLFGTYIIPYNYEFVNTFYKNK